MHRIHAFMLTLSTLVVACSSEPETASKADSPKEKAEMASPAEPDVHDVVFEAPEVTIAAGTEAMNCHFLPPLEQDLVVRGFRTKQSKGGHHMVVYRSLMQKPGGTTEDCSSGESMSNLMLVLTQTGTQEPGASEIMFPKDNVVVLPAGTQLVAQSHYINTTEEPLQTSDVMTLYATDADLDSLTRLYLFVAAANNFVIPPGMEYSARTGCVLDTDVHMLSMTPHMHEWGMEIKLEVGAEDSMKVVAEEPNWAPDMRDLPPITSFTAKGAVSDGHFQSGQSVALTCTWRNTESKPLMFPEEMCAMVGYFTTDQRDSHDIMCLMPLK